MPWSCGGHPLVELPYTIGDAHVTTAEELQSVAERAFRGETPPRVSDRERRRGGWVVRLHARVARAYQRAVLAAAMRSLDRQDAATTARALQFFHHVRPAEAQAKLLAILAGDRRGYRDIPDGETAVDFLDKTLEQTLFRVLAPDLVESHDVRVAYRTEAMEGRGSGALYDALSRYDTDWVVEHIELLVDSAPTFVATIIDSFKMIEDEDVDVDALKQRISRQS